MARLSAELQTFKSEPESAGLKDSKIALKARLNASQAHAEQNAETIKRLRAELAAANERLALQGAHFMEQMRRLGAGTLPAAGQTRRPVTQNQKLSLSERVAQSRPVLTPAAQSPVASELTEASPASNGMTATESAAHVAPDRSIGAAEPAASTTSATVIPLSSAPSLVAQHENSTIGGEARSADTLAPAETAATRKPRLVDRISNINKA